MIQQRHQHQEEGNVKSQDLREQLQRMRPPKLEKWLQQIPGTTSEASVLKSAVLGTARILQRLPQAWKRYATQDKWVDSEDLHFQISYLMWFGKWVWRDIKWRWGLGKRYILRKSDRIEPFTFGKVATAAIMSSLQHLLSRGCSLGVGDSVKQLAYQLTVIYW